MSSSFPGLQIRDQEASSAPRLLSLCLGAEAEKNEGAWRQGPLPVGVPSRAGSRPMLLQEESECLTGCLEDQLNPDGEISTEAWKTEEGRVGWGQSHPAQQVRRAGGHSNCSSHTNHGKLPPCRGSHGPWQKGLFRWLEDALQDFPRGEGLWPQEHTVLQTNKGPCASILPVCANLRGKGVSIHQLANPKTLQREWIPPSSPH